MANLNILRETSPKEYERILFERPISTLQSRRIAILTGQHARIKHINDIFQIIKTLKHQPVIIAERSELSSLLPADIFMEKSRLKSKPLYTNTDEIIATINDCNYVVIGIDFEINSALQLFLEKLIASRTSPIMFNDESMLISKVSPQLFKHRINDVFVCNIQSLLKFSKNLGVVTEISKDSGVIQKLQIMKEVSDFLSANIVVVDSRQILATSFIQANEGYISNFKYDKKVNLIGVVTAILVSLLSDNLNSSDGFLTRVATTGYLLKQGVERNDIVSTLKNIA